MGAAPSWRPWAELREGWTHFSASVFCSTLGQKKSKSSMSRYQRRLVTALDYLLPHALFRDYCTTVHMYSVYCTRAMVWCGRVRWGMNSLLVHIRGSWVHQSIQATSHLSEHQHLPFGKILENKHSNKYHYMIPPICSIIMLSAKHYFVLTPFLSKILLVLRCILNEATTTWHCHFVFDTRATPGVNISRSRCTRPKISYEATMMQRTPSITPHQRPARQKQIVAVFHLNLKCIKVHWRAFQRHFWICERLAAT